MKYYVIRKRVVHIGEQEECNDVIAIVKNERIAIAFCKKYPNAFFEEVKVNKYE